MYVLSLHIREFGGLRERHLELSRGMNLVTGDNESGKSTLIAFIRFMLYGLPKRRAGEALSDGDRAFSWENGVADGSMTVEKDGKRYRIERREQSGSTRRLLTVYDEESGDPLPKGDAPGVLLLGIPAEVFDSTACLRQLRSRDLDADGLSSAIENLLLSGDESVDAEKALKSLEKARTTLLHKNGHGGEIHHCESELAALRLSLVNAREEHRLLEEAESRRGELKRQIDETSRAHERAAEDCARLSETAILTRFDALHTEEKRLDALRRDLSAWHAAHPTGKSDVSVLRTLLEGAAERLDADERLLLAAETERKIASETPQASAEALRAAEAIRASGGADAAERRLSRCARSRRQAAVTAAILYACGGACLLLGAALALALMKPIVAFTALLGVVGLLGIPFTLRAKRAERDAAALYAELSADPRRPLRESIDRVLHDAARETERRERLRAADDEIERQRNALEARKKAAEQLLLESLRPLPEGGVTPKSLRAAASAVAVEDAERASLESRISLLSESIERMEEELSAYSEPVLRARLPEGFDYRVPDALRAYEDKRDRYKEALRTLHEEELALERRTAALRASSGDADALLAEIDEKASEKAALERTHRAVVLAIESIASARDGLRGRLGPTLRSGASQYLSTLSGGKYDRLRLGEDFGISHEENGQSHPSAAFSGGTQDAMYLSLRLALTDLLCGKGEPFPVLLDEALAQLDDTRAQALLSILLSRAESGGQVMLFTCHTREREMLKDRDVNVVVL